MKYQVDIGQAIVLETEMQPGHQGMAFDGHLLEMMARSRGTVGQGREKRCHLICIHPPEREEMMLGRYCLPAE